MPQSARLWSSVLETLRTQIAERSYETWIRPIDAVRCMDGTLVLGVPSSFFQDWVEEHYRPLIERAVAQAIAQPLFVRFEIHEKDESAEASQRQESDTPRAEPLVPSVANNTMPAPAPSPRHSIYSRHTFEHFVVGKSNEFAIAAALAVVEQPARAYNPLFIYGGVGLGKTHILRAVGQRLASRHPNMKISYLTSERFMNHMIRSIKGGTTIEFKRKYREIDCLLIDDIQFLAGKDATQEEFFHTFNSLYDAQKQIIITADCPPKQIQGLEDRLISRMGWGLICDIKPPAFETRVAILHQFAEWKSIDLHRDVALLIAENVTANIRELESCLNRLHARAHSLGRRVDVELAKQLLADLFQNDEPDSDPTSPERIVEEVCRAFGVSLSEVRGKRRTRAIALPRQVAMFLLRDLTTLSLQEIGKRLGDRDHSTVLHACSKIGRMKADDPGVRQKLAEVTRSLGVPC